MGEDLGTHQWWDGEQPCFRPEYPSEGAQAPEPPEPRRLTLEATWDAYQAGLDTLRERFNQLIDRDDRYVAVELDTGREIG